MDADFVCCFVHIRTCTWIILLLEVIVSGIRFGILVANVGPKDDDSLLEADLMTMANARILQYVDLAFWSIFLASSWLLLWALCAFKPKLMVPHIAISIMMSAYIFLRNAMKIYVAFNDNYFLLLATGIFIIVMFIAIFSEFKCYAWMRRLRNVGFYVQL